MKMNLVLCNHCKTLLISKYSGQYLSCQCGKCMVDQTEHYCRYGGSPEDFQSFTIDVDWSLCDKPFSRNIVTTVAGLREADSGGHRRGAKAKKSNPPVQKSSKAQRMVRKRNKKTTSSK